jgi:hypothetical protein
MNFGFSEEQDELRKMVRRFLEEKSPETEVRRLMATEEGYDPAVWSQMANELALQGLGIPEEFGGQGYGPVELYVVFEEMGAALLCAPYFSTVALAANALLFVGNEKDHAAYLPGIASGETIATVALTDDAGMWDLRSTSTTATREGDHFVISGVRSYVTDGSTATLLLVPAVTDKGLSLFAVAGDAEGVTREALSTMDQTRKQSRIELKDAPATLVGVEGEALAGLETTLQVAAAALAAEQVGGAQRVLDATRWSTPRIGCSSVDRSDRFRPSSTSVRTCCLTWSRRSRLRTTRRGRLKSAMTSWRSRRVSRSRFAPKRIFTVPQRTFRFTVGSASRGSTHAHLYFKRAKSSELFLGDPAYHRELLAQRLGI